MCAGGGGGGEGGEGALWRVVHLHMVHTAYQIEF